MNSHADNSISDRAGTVQRAAKGGKRARAQRSPSTRKRPALRGTPAVSTTSKGR